MPVYTFSPQAGSGGSNVSCDGFVQRFFFSGESFSVIRAGAGTSATVASATMDVQTMAAASGSLFQDLQRGIMTFDTSSMVGPPVAASLSLYTAAKNTGLGSTRVDVVSAAPASNNTLVAADYSTLGTTIYGSTPSISGLTLSTRVDVELNGLGLSAISPTITKLGLRLGWDTDNSFGGVWAANQFCAVSFGTADDATHAPILTVETGGSGIKSMFCPELP